MTVDTVAKSLHAARQFIMFSGFLCLSVFALHLFFINFQYFIWPGKLRWLSTRSIGRKLNIASYHNNIMISHCHRITLPINNSITMILLMTARYGLQGARCSILRRLHATADVCDGSLHSISVSVSVCSCIHINIHFSYL